MMLKRQERYSNSVEEEKEGSAATFFRAVADAIEEMERHAVPVSVGFHGEIGHRRAELSASREVIVAEFIPSYKS